MDKVGSSIVVLMVTFISAAFAASFVFGQTSFLSGYSSDVQNQSECTRLGETGQEEEYQDMGCGEIYGNIQTFEIEDADNGVTKMDGVVIGAWPSYTVYDSRETYNYEIDFEELDGQEYLSDVHGAEEWNGGEFEYDPDLYYTVGFEVFYPTGSDSSENPQHWGGNVGNVCHDQQTCQISNNFTYSEPGNMSENLTPCQVTDRGDQSQFYQRVFIQIFEERNGDSFDGKQGWIEVMNQSLDLRDTRFNDCWTEGALPTFEDGQMFLREMKVNQDFMIEQQQQVNVTVDLSNDRRNVENVSLLMVYPNGTEESRGDREKLLLDNVTVGEDCREVCALNASVNLDEEVNIPMCSQEGEGWRISELFLQIREEYADEDESPVDWQVEEMTPMNDYVQNNPLLERCWPEDIPRIM